MIRRAFRRGLSLGILAAVAAAAVRAVQGRKGGPLGPLPAGGAWPATTAPVDGGTRASLVPTASGATTVGVDVVAAPGPDPQPVRDAEAEPADDALWLDPVERGCPASHPVKVRLASGIFHLPGMLDYERTKPDRCYVDATAAESDGFRPAMR